MIALGRAYRALERGVRPQLAERGLAITPPELARCPSCREHADERGQGRALFGVEQPPAVVKRGLSLADGKLPEPRRR